MCEVQNLSFDAVHCILEWISIEDIVNFGWTCKRLHMTVWEPSNNQLLRRKFFQGWPSLKNVCDSLWHSKDIDIKKEIMQKLKCTEEFLHYFTRYIHTILYNESGIDDMSDIDKLCCTKRCGCFKYYYVEDDLMNILKRDDATHSNLRDIYCADKILSYIRHRRMTEKWHMFTHLPAEKQLSEIVAAYVTQRCQPQSHVFYAHISALLDDLANKVLDFLKEHEPTHTVHSISEEQFSIWRENNIEEHNWNMTETSQIIYAIHNIMHSDFYASEYNHRHHRGSIRYKHKKYCDKIIENNMTKCMIDMVLKNRHGNDTCVAIIFQSVARRLGVRCDLMKFRYGFFLCWTESYTSPMLDFPSDYNDHILFHHCNYFDYNTNIIARPDLIQISVRDDEFRDYEFRRMTPVELLLQLTLPCMGFNVRRDTMRGLKNGQLEMLQIRNMANPRDKEMLDFLLMSCCVTLSSYKAGCYTHIDLNNLRTMLEKSLNTIESWLNRKDSYCAKWNKRKKEILDTLQCIERCWTNMQYYFHNQEPKKRVQELEYGVGMIVLLRNKDCLGVIIGWDTVFNEEIANILGTSSENQEINSRPPYYIILCSHNVTLYVSQDMVIPTINLSDELIIHDEIGRYFVYYETTHYLPNSVLNTIYPDDADVCRRYVYYIKKNRSLHRV